MKVFKIKKVIPVTINYIVLSLGLFIILAWLPYYFIYNLAISYKPDEIEITLPTFKPRSDSGWEGSKTVSRDEENEDEELISIWNNSRATNKSSSTKGEIKIIEKNNIICRIQAIGNSSNTDQVSWRIESKRNALSKIAHHSWYIYKDENKAKSAFIEGKLESLKYQENEKTAIVIFQLRCL